MDFEINCALTVVLSPAVNPLNSKKGSVRDIRNLNFHKRTIVRNDNKYR